MSLYKNTRSLIFVLIFGLLMAGCSTAAPTATLTPTDIRFQMSWTHEYSAAGYYVSEKKGYFAKENLKVDLLVGGYADGRYIQAEDEVMGGRADFGLSNAAGILQARADGQPLVAIMTVIQRNPITIISLKGSNIQQPQDLIGKTVAVSEGGATQLLNTLLVSQGIDVASVNIVPRTDFGVQVLLDGTVDALVGWIINEGVAVREAGAEPNFMLISDYGIPDYATLIFTTEEMINNKPQVVQSFISAIIAGWDDVIKDPEGAVISVLAYNDQLNQDEQLSRLQASIPLLQPSQAKVGSMDKATWDNISKVLKEAGVLTADVDVDSAFTTTFLDKIYGQ